VCPQVSIGPGESVPGERLADFSASDDPRSAPRGIAHVSTNVIDMAFADDGALVVVSDSSVGRGPPQYLPDGTPLDGDAARWGETIVWRVVPAPESAPSTVEDVATVIGRFPRETVVTRLSRSPGGALAFVTLTWPGGSSEVRVNLHVTDGSTVTTSYTDPGPEESSTFNWLADPTFVNPGIYLSPDGSSLITTWDENANALVWMNTDPSDRVRRFFAHPPWILPPSGSRRFARIYAQFAHGGAAWLTSAVAIWSGGDLLVPYGTASPGVVDVYEASPPHEFRYQYVADPLPGATSAPALVGALAVGDRLVLTTTTGVRVLDASGALVAGFDPLPCGATTTASAEQIGPTTIGFGVGTNVITLDVGPEVP
jgi:hypothetical protein